MTDSAECHAHTCECILAGLIEHCAMQSLSFSMTHYLCLPVTHSHTQKPNDRNTVQAVRNPPGVGSNTVIPLYLSQTLFIFSSLFSSLPVFVHTSFCSTGLQSNKSLLWACFLLYPFSQCASVFAVFFF